MNCKSDNVGFVSCLQCFFEMVHSQNNMSTCMFEMVHCDIWVPYHLASYSDFRYFLIFLDDCSCFMWTCLLKHKSDKFLVIPKLL